MGSSSCCRLATSKLVSKFTSQSWLPSPGPLTLTKFLSHFLALTPKLSVTLEYTRKTFERYEYRNDFAFACKSPFEASSLVVADGDRVLVSCVLKCVSPASVCVLNQRVECPNGPDLCLVGNPNTDLLCRPVLSEGQKLNLAYEFRVVETTSPSNSCTVMVEYLPINDSCNSVVLSDLKDPVLDLLVGRLCNTVPASPESCLSTSDNI